MYLENNFCNDSYVTVVTSDDGTPAVSRRRLLAVSGGVIGSAAVGVGPSVVTTADETSAISYLDAELVETEVAGAYDESYCAVDSSLAADLGVSEGMQLRVSADDPEAGVEYSEKLFTVADVVSDGLDGIGAAEAELTDIGADDGSSAGVSATVPHPEYDTRAEADAHDEFVESVTNESEAADSDVLLLGPHGKYIERGSGKQVERVASEYGLPGWVCYGFNSGGGAKARWHVTSTEIDPRSFPKLDEVADEHFEAVVAFHGQTDDEVTVGGAYEELRGPVGEALRTAYDEEEIDVPVEVVDGGENAGVSSDNVVNGLSCDGESGVQIEQPIDVRENQEYADVTAKTVVETVRRHC